MQNKITLRVKAALFKMHTSPFHILKERPTLTQKNLNSPKRKSKLVHWCNQCSLNVTLRIFFVKGNFVAITVVPMISFVIFVSQRNIKAIKEIKKRKILFHHYYVERMVQRQLHCSTLKDSSPILAVSCTCAVLLWENASK